MKFYHSYYCLAFLIPLLCSSSPLVGITTSTEDIFQRVLTETENHKSYLTELGLGERAQGIQVCQFKRPECIVSDLAVFDRRTTLPCEVINFDPKEPNTLLVGEKGTLNDPVELAKILDIRLYPTLREYIRQEKLEVFLGSRTEMASYYQNKGLEIILQFNIPSSATYYLARSSSGEEIVIMAGLVSRENLIAQLLTLKLAEIPLESVTIIGEVDHFKILVERDITTIIQSNLLNASDTHVLIVAGCGLQETVKGIIQSKYPAFVKQSSFHGNIIHFDCVTIYPTPTRALNCIVLDLVYGEIMETIVQSLLERFSCSSVFSSSAGGYIIHKDTATPPIGEWIPIKKSMNMTGEVVTLTQEETLYTHLQIPSIFMETFKWLHQAQKIGSSVDVETFYILRAIKNHNIQHPMNIVKAHCGYFVSDYVGKQPLRDYSLVYRQYPRVLLEFFEAIVN